MSQHNNNNGKKESKVEHVNILIVGAGPTGLGAATRIHELQRQFAPPPPTDAPFQPHGDIHPSAASSATSSSASRPEPKTDIGKLTHLLLDSNPSPGGLASTHRTPQNFLFDLGGHVIFSHYAYFDDLLQHAVGGRYDDDDDSAGTNAQDEKGGNGGDHRCWCVHRRESYVYMDKTFVPYPFQLNFGKLGDLEMKADCLKGLIDLEVERRVERRVEEITNCATGHDRRRESKRPRRVQNFDEWILASMGKGIHSIFMKPYNYKVWSYPATEMSATWLGERVATVDLDHALRNVLRQRDKGSEKAKDEEHDWGPNSTFAFPAYGGTGAIWEAVANKTLSKNNQRYNTTITAIDLSHKSVTCNDGSQIKYDYLINTMPLDITLRMVGKPHLADRLRYSSTHIIGIGIRGVTSHKKKCWLYYPEDATPFYRCTIFSNYADGNCPAEDVLLPTIARACDYTDGDDTVEGGDGSVYDSLSQSIALPKPGPYHSLMFEISSSAEHRPMADDDQATIIADTIRGAIHSELMCDDDEIVSVFYRRLERGYPTPHLDRDAVLEEALPYLKLNGGMYSRGRFGSWKYEVANQDHSLMLGVEAVDNIIFNSPEVTLESPNVINGNKGVKRYERRFYAGFSGKN